MIQRARSPSRAARSGRFRIGSSRRDVVGDEGFEPPMSETARLQRAAIGHYANPPCGRVRLASRRHPEHITRPVVERGGVNRRRSSRGDGAPRISLSTVVLSRDSAEAEPCIPVSRFIVTLLARGSQGRQDLNLQHPVLETGALPFELHPYVLRSPRAVSDSVTLPTRAIMVGTLRFAILSCGWGKTKEPPACAGGSWCSVNLCYCTIT